MNPYLKNKLICPLCNSELKILEKSRRIYYCDIITYTIFDHDEYHYYVDYFEDLEEFTIHDEYPWYESALWKGKNNNTYGLEFDGSDAYILGVWFANGRYEKLLELKANHRPINEIIAKVKNLMSFI